VEEDHGPQVVADSENNNDTRRRTREQIRIRGMVRSERSDLVK